MAASNRSIRMKHGTTALHIMPLNRNITIPLKSGTTQRNLTTPLNSGTQRIQRDTTTLFKILEQNALQASSSDVPAQWKSPSSPSLLTVPTSYRAQVPKPLPGSGFSAPPYNFPPPYIAPSNISTTSKFPKRSQYSTPPYVPPCSCPPYTTQSSMPVYTSHSPSLTYTSQSSTTSNTSQTSTSSIRSQSSASAYSPRYPIPTDSTAYSVPTYTSRPSTSTCNLSPSLHANMNPRSANYRSYPFYSHYTFPRSADYTKPLSMNESSINVWPTEIGSVMQVSMENVCLVLATEMQNASQPSTTARADLIARRVNDQSMKCVNPKPSDSTKTASDSNARNHSEQSEEILMPLYKNNNENIDTQLHNAWVYLKKLEIVDMKPNGEIKCICPMIQFEDLLKLTINDKHILVNLHRHYEINSKYTIHYKFAYSRYTLYTICTLYINILLYKYLYLFVTFCNFVISCTWLPLYKCVKSVINYNMNEFCVFNRIRVLKF